MVGDKVVATALPRQAKDATTAVAVELKSAEQLSITRALTPIVARTTAARAMPPPS